MWTALILTNNNTTVSWLMGLLDYAFVLVKYVVPNKAKFFRHGYGNVQDYHRIVATLWQEAAAAPKKTLDSSQTSFSTEQQQEQQQEEKACFVLQENDIEWGPIITHPRNLANITLQNAKFQSPIARHLPPEAKYCSFSLVRPMIVVDPAGEEQTSSNGDSSSTRNTTTAKTRTKRMVYILMLPATGEEGISTRLQMAHALAIQYGWCSVLLTAPYYNNRKPNNQTRFFLPQVKDVFWQGCGLITEAGSLAAYFLQQQPPPPPPQQQQPQQQQHPQSSVVCFTGFSFGAAMSACAAHWVLHLPGTDGQRLGVCAYAGCHSPNCFADGVLQSGIDWSALVGLSPPTSFPDHEKYAHPIGQKHQKQTTKQVPAALESARLALFQELSKAQLSSVVPLSPTNTKKYSVKVVKAVNMKHDAFIKPCHAREFEQQIQQCLLGGTKEGGTFDKDGIKNEDDRPRKDENSLSSLASHKNESKTIETKETFQTQWLPGGHVIAALLRPFLHKKLLVETVQELLSEPKAPKVLSDSQEFQ
ncbi:hypothetical protein ACA910_001166 [Epithemia clementina (nom. ined.)]